MRLNCKHVGKHVPSLAQRPLSKVMAVEVEQIEGIESGFGRRTFAAPSTQRFLQGAEIGRSPLVEHNSLAIEDRAIDTELQRVMSNRRKAGRPIMAASGDDPHLLTRDMDGETISVPLHLEGPIISSRRLSRKQCKARLDPLGHRVDEEVALKPFTPRRSLDGIDAQPGSENPTRTHWKQPTQRNESLTGGFVKRSEEPEASRSSLLA